MPWFLFEKDLLNQYKTGISIREIIATWRKPSHISPPLILGLQSNPIHMRGGRGAHMIGHKSIRHVVVTPSRNDEIHLRELFNSMVNQTLPPSEWVIVLHNPKENISQSLQSDFFSFKWISIATVNDDSKRKRGAQIARMVNFGISQLSSKWDYLSKIDADMTLPRDYFEQIFSEFSENPNLGIASGSCYIVENNSRKKEKVSENHTRGGLKTYRGECYDQICGIREVDGWDGVDNIVAQMRGWETMNFPKIEVLHGRRTGSSSGLLRGCFESGSFAYSMRYFFPFIIARSIHQMFRKPILLGGIFMFSGYIFGVITMKKPSLSKDEAIFFHKSQKNRLAFWRR